MCKNPTFCWTPSSAFVYNKMKTKNCGQYLAFSSWFLIPSKPNEKNKKVNLQMCKNPTFCWTLSSAFENRRVQAVFSFQNRMTTKTVASNQFLAHSISNEKNKNVNLQMCKNPTFCWTPSSAFVSAKQRSSGFLLPLATFKVLVMHPDLS